MQHNERINVKPVILGAHINTKQGPVKVTLQSKGNTKTSDRIKLMSEMGFYSPRAVNDCDVKNKVSQSPKHHLDAQLATFSAADLRGCQNDRKTKDSHEAMLRKELVKFRSEIEVKYKKSQINHEYQFPRSKTDTSSNDEPEGENPPATDRINCKI